LGPRANLDDVERRTFLPITGLELRTLSRSVGSAVAIPTAPSLLPGGSMYLRKVCNPENHNVSLSLSLYVAYKIILDAEFFERLSKCWFLIKFTMLVFIPEPEAGWEKSEVVK
jgi:hypothetical protein